MHGWLSLHIGKSCHRFNIFYQFPMISFVFLTILENNVILA